MIKSHIVIQALHAIVPILLAAGSITLLSCEMPLDSDPFPPPGPAPTCFDYGAAMGIESYTGLRAFDIEIVDGYAYLSGDNIQILKLTPGSPPVVTATLSIPAFRLARVDGGLCLGGGSSFGIIDVTAGARGRELAKMGLPFFTRDMAGAGRYAYLIDYEFGLWVIDTTDPAAPQIVGSVAIPGERRAIAARNDLVAVATDTGLWIIDVADPTSPQRLGFYRSDYGVIAVELVDRFAITSYGPLIEVIDLVDPMAPELVVRPDIAISVIWDMAFDGTRGYLCGDDLTVVDLTRPASPTIIARIPRVYSKQMALMGERAYLAGDGGFIVAHFAGPRRPSPLVHVNAEGTAWRTALIPPMAILAGTVRGLWVVDFRGSPGVSGRLDLDAYAYDVVTDSTYAYVAAGGLRIAEIETTLPPHLVSRLDLPGESLAIVLDGHLAYIAQRQYGLWIADVTDPLAPRIVGSVDTRGDAYDVVVRDGWAWVAGLRAGLTAVDVSNPESPRIASHLEIPECRAVTLAGHYAYVGSERGHLDVVDISVPTTPEIVGELEDLGQISDVAVDGNLAYLASTNGLLVADVTEPRSPMLVGTANENRAFGVLVDKETGRIYVANGDLEVLRPQCRDAMREDLP